MDFAPSPLKSMSVDGLYWSVPQNSLPRPWYPPFAREGHFSKPPQPPSFRRDESLSSLQQTPRWSFIRSSHDNGNSLPFVVLLRPSSLRIARSRFARGSTFFTHSFPSSNTSSQMIALLILRSGKAGSESLTPLLACLMTPVYALLFPNGRLL